MTPTASADLPEAFYLPVSQDEFDSTRATASPWDLTMQHGGPPAALLSRAVERVRPDDGMLIGRITIDMLGPIPQGRIRTAATILRPGRRIELVEAKLWVDERLAVTATAWRIRSTAGSTAAQAHIAKAPPLPAEQPQRYFPGVDPGWGYGLAIEWRFAHGSFDQLGPADVWVRPRIPIVAGEQPSPVQRVAVVADSANGLSAELPMAEWMFIPPTMTLTLGREPEGAWTNIAARTVIGDSGTGISHATLHDQAGFLGTVGQPLLVAPRS